MFVASLEEAGFNVIAAGNGAEALALLEADEPVDVLVSDLFMRVGWSSSARRKCGAPGCLRCC